MAEQCYRSLQVQYSLVIFATRVKKRKAEIKIHAFFGFLVGRLPLLEIHCAVYTDMQIAHKLD